MRTCGRENIDVQFHNLTDIHAERFELPGLFRNYHLAGLKFLIILRGIKGVSDFMSRHLFSTYCIAIKNVQLITKN